MTTSAQALPASVQVIAEVDAHGGTGRYLLQLLDFYKRHGIDVELTFAVGRPNDSFLEAVELLGARLGSALDSWNPPSERAVWPRQFIADRSALKTIAKDLLSKPTLFSVANPDLLVALASKMEKSLYLVHSYPPSSTNLIEDAFRRLTGRRLLGSEFRPVAVSRFAAHQLSRHWGISSSRVSTIYHQAAAVTMPKAESHEPLTIVTLGHVVDYKGIDVWLDVVGMLAPRLREIHARMSWWGIGPDLDWARAEVARLDVGDVACFEGFTNDPMSVLSCSSIYFQPSRVESAGLGVLEAMASGTPVVASSVGGIPEILGVSSACAPIDVEDAAGMASAIDKLLGDAPLRQNVGELLRRRANENFSSEAWDRAWIRLHSLIT